MQRNFCVIVISVASFLIVVTYCCCQDNLFYSTSKYSYTMHMEQCNIRRVSILNLTCLPNCFSCFREWVNFFFYFFFIVVLKHVTIVNCMLSKCTLLQMQLQLQFEMFQVLFILNWVWKMWWITLTFDSGNCSCCYGCCIKVGKRVKKEI